MHGSKFSGEAPNPEMLMGMNKKSLLFLAKGPGNGQPSETETFLTINPSPEKHRLSGDYSPMPTSISKGLVESLDLHPCLVSVPIPARVILRRPKRSLYFQPHPGKDRCLVPFP